MTAWRCRCRRRFRRTSRRPSSDCRRSRSWCSSMPTPTTTPTQASRVQLRADRPLPGSDRRACGLALGERIAREFIDMETPRFEADHGGLSRPLRPEAGQPRGGSPRPSCRRSRRPRPASTPTGSPGWPRGSASWNRGTSSILLRLLAARLALDPRRLPAAGSSRRARAVLRADRRPSPSIRGRSSSLLGELPFLTGLYERGRRELTPDDNLSVDGVKEMVLDARDRLRAKLPKVAAADHAAVALGLLPLRPQPLADRPPAHARPLHAGRRRQADGRRRLRPGAGRDGPRIPVRRRRRRSTDERFDDRACCGWGSTGPRCPGWGTGPMVSRLPGQALSWRTCELRPRPLEEEQTRWQQRWNPFGMCSWPPEDDRIESFHRHVRDQAKAILGADLARTEKFTTSVRDGIDIRETLRNWHTGDLYVKVVPPSRGSIEVVVFLFDVPGRPRGLHQPHDLVCRARRGIDPGLLRHRPHEEPGRPGDRPGRVRRCALPLPAPADPRHLDRPPARLRRHAGGAAARRGVPAQPGPARRGRQPQAARRPPGGGWPGGSAARSSTCR